MAVLVIAAAAIAVAGCGGSEPELEVGACTTADPTEALSTNVEAVDCDDEDAKSKVVKEVEKSDQCDVASVSDPEADKVFCTEPHPPGSAPAKLEVGVCTTADPKQLVSVNIRLVNCDHKDAKSRVVKRAKSERECEEGSVRGEKDEVYCIEPV
jgi:hypothetical protein